MFKRCYSPNERGYERYGAKGVIICEEWKDFAVFWKDMGGTYFKTASIDRLDNAKGYSKDNCRWATALEQSRNRRNVHHFPFQGKTLTLGELAKETGINRETLYFRLVINGWTLKRALSLPPSYGNWKNV